jgi:hypothetical protein
LERQQTNYLKNTFKKTAYDLNRHALNSKNVNDAIKQRIIGAVKNFEGKYTESQVFKHSLSKGEYREQPIQEFFRELLPNKFAVLSGEIIDYKGNVSPQSDLIIYRNIDGIPVFKTEPTILLAESVMGIIEVKSKINLDEYEDCLKKAEKLYKLKPFGKSIQQYERGRNPTNKEVRIFISVFAYSSDSKMSMKDEYARFIKRAEELSINPCVIDRIYTLPRYYYLILTVNCSLKQFQRNTPNHKILGHKHLLQITKVRTIISF